VAPEDFIRRHTRLQQPPLVPEVALHLADDIMRLWERLGEESESGNPNIPFWGSAWVGGQALARYILDHPAEVAGKRVFDLATGSGLCAIAAIQAGAATVAAADVDPLATCAAALNAAANGTRIEITTRDVLTRPPPRADVILAGDVCYEEEMAAQILPWLETAQRAGTQVLIGDPGRHYFPREIMVLLDAYDVPTTWAVEGAETKRTGVYTFASGKPSGATPESGELPG
jgi:predicted nicotinamide N-methyase